MTSKTDSSIARDDEVPASGTSSELLRRLSEHSLKASRYKLEGEVARGGMSAVLIRDLVLGSGTK